MTNLIISICAWTLVAATIATSTAIAAASTEKVTKKNRVTKVSAVITPAKNMLGAATTTTITAAAIAQIKPPITKKQNCSPTEFLDQQASVKCQMPANLEVEEEDKISKAELLQQRRHIKKSLKEFFSSASFEDTFPELKTAERQNQLESPFWQTFVNQALSKIFRMNSLSDASLFCKVIPLTSEQFALQFGMSSRRLADSLHSRCFKNNTNAIQSFFGNQVAMKEYIFVKVDLNFPYSGWTESGNTTYIFVKENATWGDLVLAMIHEMAIGMDSKMNQNIISFFSQHPEAETADFNADEEWRELFNMAVLPEIAYTFAAMRANRIMSLAVKEVVQAAEEIKSEAKSQAEEANAKALREEFNRLFSKLRSWQIPTGKGSFATAYNNNIIAKARALYPSLDEAVKLILNSEKKMQLSSDGPEIDFLTYMATPEIGAKSAATTKANGPGCGYCGTSFSPQTIESWNTIWDKQLLPFINGPFHEIK